MFELFMAVATIIAGSFGAIAGLQLYSRQTAAGLRNLIIALLILGVVLAVYADTH